MTKPSHLTFEVIDRNHKDADGNADFLKHITTRELGMLVNMLDGLNHDNMEVTKKAYGWADNPAQWNLRQLEVYKEGILRSRMEKEVNIFGTPKNYTFFLLKDEAGETVALASGNAYENKLQLRLLNVAVQSGHQGEGLELELVKRVSHWAKTNEFPKIVMPLSHHALEHGNVELYQNMASELGLSIAQRPHFNIDTGQLDVRACQMEVTPKLFKALEPGNQSRGWMGLPSNPAMCL